MRAKYATAPGFEPLVPTISGAMRPALSAQCDHWLSVYKTHVLARQLSAQLVHERVARYAF